MAESYLTVALFRTRSLMPGEDIDTLEVSQPGYLLAQLTAATARVDAQLRKRYAVPFAEPVPEIVLDWVTRKVTPRAYLKRGYNPSNDASFAALLSSDAALADAEIAAAADAVSGLYDLPLRQDTTTSGISRGAPLGYSETSPYAWRDAQRTTGQGEDR
jgi:hypothetical protein